MEQKSCLVNVSLHNMPENKTSSKLHRAFGDVIDKDNCSDTIYLDFSAGFK